MNVIKCLPVRLEHCDPQLFIGVELKGSLSNHDGACLTMERSGFARFARDLSFFLYISQPFSSYSRLGITCFAVGWTTYALEIRNC